MKFTFLKLPLLRYGLAVVCVLTAFNAREAHCAITEVYVAKGHTLFNVEQKLSKKNRVAKTHSISGVCISANAEDPNETANPAALHVGSVTAIGGGRYKFNLRADYTAKEGTYTVQFRDNSLKNNKALNPKLMVHIREVAVTAISFLEGEPAGLGIRIPGEPSDSVITAYEWQNGSRNDPGAWVRGGTKKIKVQMRGSADNTFNVWADGTWGGIDTTSVTFDANGAATKLMEIDQFPEIVTKVNAGWNWKVSRQGEQSNINTTGHKIFVVYKTPISNAKYLQLYEFGCGWADGQITEDKVNEKIWFGLSGGRIRLEGDGDTPYWRYWGSKARGIASENYQQLFIKRDGQCGAWAMFGVELLRL